MLWSVGNFSLYERLVAKYGGAAAMYFVSKKLKKKHNITDERQALYGAAEQWVDALKGRKFLGMFKFNDHNNWDTIQKMLSMCVTLKTRNP